MGHAVTDCIITSANMINIILLIPTPPFIAPILSPAAGSIVTSLFFQLQKVVLWRFNATMVFKISPNMGSMKTALRGWRHLFSRMRASNAMAEISKDVCDHDAVDVAMLRRELIGDYKIWKADGEPKCYEVSPTSLHDNDPCWFLPQAYCIFYGG